MFFHITIFSKTDIEKKFRSEYWKSKYNRTEVVKKYLKLNLPKDIIFKLVVQTHNKRLDPISRKLISLVLDSLAVNKNSLVKEIDKYGRNPYFYMKAYGQETLAKKKYKEYGVSPLSYDSNGGTFYSRFLDRKGALKNSMSFLELGGTFDTVINKKGMTAFQYLKNKETILSLYNILIRDSSDYEVYLGRLIEVDNDKKFIANLAALTEEILVDYQYWSFDNKLGKYLMKIARQILAKNDLSLIELDNSEINILSKILSLKKTIINSHYNVNNRQKDKKLQPSHPYETFLTNILGTLNVSSAKFVGGNYISKRILCFDKDFNVVNLIKAHEVDVRERNGIVQGEIELDHHFYGVSYLGIVGVSNCSFLIDLDRNKHFKYPFDKVYAKSISIKAQHYMMNIWLIYFRIR
jgi:hypothetical protein